MVSGLSIACLDGAGGRLIGRANAEAISPSGFDTSLSSLSGSRTLTGLLAVTDG